MLLLMNLQILVLRNLVRKAPKRFILSSLGKFKKLLNKIKLNHPPEVIVGNMNELTLRKRIVNKYVANFVSYSCYLSQVKPIKVEEALQDES